VLKHSLIAAAVGKAGCVFMSVLCPISCPDAGGIGAKRIKPSKRRKLAAYRCRAVTGHPFIVMRRILAKSWLRRNNFFKIKMVVGCGLVYNDAILR